MTTAYPSGLDSWTNPTGVSNLSDVPVLHSAAHANLNDAVEALEAELGLLPKGGSASVRARLDALDTTVAAKALASRTISAGTGLTGGGDLSTNRTLTVDLEYLQDSVATMLVAGQGVTLTYDDTGGTLTVSDDGAQTINAQTGTTYTPVATDAGKLVTLSNAGAITVTLPQDSSLTFAIGKRIDFAVIGAGMATFTAGAGATVNATPSAVTRAQYSSVSAIKRAANTWLLVGDLA